MKLTSHKNVLVIVAHPDDETLWAGGVLLDHPGWTIFIKSLCRKSDSDRAPKFQKGLQAYGATGRMEDLDDGPDQTPLDQKEVEEVILKNLPSYPVELIITHSPFGEYTRHRRHEEIGSAVISLWKDRKITTGDLWLFAYDDGNRTRYPQPIPEADMFHDLSKATFQTKYNIITDIYGFSPHSWEARCCPRTEAFWQFSSPAKACAWLHEPTYKPKNL